MPSGWFGTAHGSRHYFMRIIHQKNTYIGGCICAERLLSIMKGNGLSGVDYLTFLKKDEGDFCAVLPDYLSEIAGSGVSVRDTRRIGAARYLLVEEPLKKGIYSLMAVIRDKSVLEGLSTLQSTYPILILLTALFLFVFIRLQDRWILTPTGRICDAMERMRDGDLDVRLDYRGDGAEFRLIEETFNEMAENIESLKIDVYEEKMQRQQTELTLQKEKYAYQKSELQYLQLQINPHFYINCLNIINNLSITNRGDLIQKMTAYLGNHLRYTLEGNVTEPLQREIEYVRNYAHIQELRFGDSLTMNMEVEPGLEMVQVPPLVIQTFVENTVKYEVVPGESTEIYIVASWEDYPENTRILIEIWDDGDGYPEDVLEKLGSGEKIWRDDRERFGIRNLAGRIRLIYGNEGRIEFANHFETGGAYVRISLPARGASASALPAAAQNEAEKGSAASANVLPAVAQDRTGKGEAI